MAPVQNMCLLCGADEKEMLGHRVVLWHLLSGGIFPLLPEKEVVPNSVAGCRWEVLQNLDADKAFSWNLKMI